MDTGIEAPQLQFFTMSLAWNMLIVAGEVPKEFRKPRFENPTAHTEFIATFRHLKKGNV